MDDFFFIIEILGLEGLFILGLSNTVDQNFAAFLKLSQLKTILPDLLRILTQNGLFEVESDSPLGGMRSIFFVLGEFLEGLLCSHELLVDLIAFCKQLFINRVKVFKSSR